MHRAVLPALIFAALSGVPAPVASAQDQALPAEVVAQVGPEPIPKADFDHWLRISVRSFARRAVLDPPWFERCVAVKRKQRRRSERAPSRRTLRRECREEYETVKDEVMRFLLQAVWVRHEAALHGIAVSPQSVRRRLEQQISQVFPSRRAYRRFLRQSGMTEADLLDRVELNLLQFRLTEAARSEAAPVTGAEVDRYFANHRPAYRGISRRRARARIRVLLTHRREERALEAYIADFRARFRSITTCAEGYVVPECATGP